MGTAIKHPVPDRVKPSFVIFNMQALSCHMGIAIKHPAAVSDRVKPPFVVFDFWAL